ncbi:MAG: creatininase family protein, partial [Acidobacteriota bacterium]
VSADDVRQMGLTGEPPSWVLLHQMPRSWAPKTPYLDIHAGAGETAMVAAFFPDTLDAKLAKTLPATRLTGQGFGEWQRDPRKTTPLGYVGDPARYDAEKARNFVQDWCRMMAEAIASYMAKSR